MTEAEPSDQLHQLAALRGLLAYSVDAITVLSPEGRVLQENHEATRLAGHTPVGRSRHTIFDRVHPDDLSRTRAVIDRARGSADPVGPFQLRLRHANGSWVALEAFVRSIGNDAGERVCVLSAREVTEHRVFEEAEVLRAQRVDALERLAGAIAHDCNNVLTAILGNADRALAGTLPGGLRPKLVEIREAAEVATSLVQQLHLFSQKRLKRTDVVDVCETIGQMEAVLRRMLRPDVRLTVTSMITGPAHVHLAHGSLEQIVMNLVVNARDAMPHGGQIHLTIDRSAISGAENGGRDFVTVRVADTGVGMTPQVRARAFEPYFTTKAVGKGMGLGLATVHGIVTDAGGLIDVMTEAGRGTTVSVHLSRALPQT